LQVKHFLRKNEIGRWAATTGGQAAYAASTQAGDTLEELGRLVCDG